MNGLLGKIGGWAAFLLSLLSGVTANGAPHGWAGWLQVVAGFAMAVGIHASSNVGQITKPAAASIGGVPRQ